MKNKVLPIMLSGLLIFSLGCNKENDDPTPDSPGGNDNTNTTSCDELPQFADDQHQNFYSTIGSSCVSTSYYDHNQIGSATLVESDANPECSVPDTAYYSIHMGHANAEDQTVSFDVNIYFLTDVPVTAGDEYDLSENWIHAYWSFNDNGTIKQVKATEGSLVLSATDENADLEGELTFEGEEFVADEAIDSHVKGLGDFVENGEEVSVSAHFLAQDHGLTPDCE